MAEFETREFASETSRPPLRRIGTNRSHLKENLALVGNSFWMRTGAGTFLTVGFHFALARRMVDGRSKLRSRWFPSRGETGE